MPKPNAAGRLSSLAWLALGFCLGGCGHSRRDLGRPEASLSASSDAQTAFRVLRAAWFAGSSTERRKLDRELRAFLRRFPEDPQSDMVRALLAYDSVSRGALPEARALIANIGERAGSVRDFSQLVLAYALLRENKTEAAWSMLEPLAGKIVDGDERLSYSELRLRVATSAHDYARALRAAEELLAEAPAEAQSALQDLVRELFRAAPKAALVASLASSEPTGAAEGAPLQAREWLRKMLRERLVAIAVSERDAALARSLLDSAPAALRASASGSALVGIAGGGQTVPMVLGRSVGIALSLGNADARRRSVAAAAGLARGLGLPEAVSEPGGVQLISQDDGGTSAGTERALRDLAAEGATILVGGVDGPSADAAARFAEANSIPVVLLESPETVRGPFHFAFVLGESATSEQAALDLELSRRKLLGIARVGRAGEACDAPLLVAGTGRFSVQEWRRNRVSALLVLGSPACASDVARELRAQRFAPELALGLEAAPFVYANDVPNRRFALGAGKFPAAARPDAEVNQALPPLDWYEALGHDAALLAREALQGFPEGRVADARAVRELHARAVRALGTVQAALWTSDSRGFSETHVLPRVLEIVSPDSQPSSTP